jgi:hypothetical protein
LLPVLVKCLALRLSGDYSDAPEKPAEPAAAAEPETAEEPTEGAEDVKIDSDAEKKEMVKKIKESGKVGKAGASFNIETEEGKASIGVGVSKSLQLARNTAGLRARTAFARYGETGETVSKTLTGVSINYLGYEKVGDVYHIYAQAYQR